MQYNIIYIFGRGGGGGVNKVYFYMGNVQGENSASPKGLTI